MTAAESQIAKLRAHLERPGKRRDFAAWFRLAQLLERRPSSATLVSLGTMLREVYKSNYPNFDMSSPTFGLIRREGR